MFACFLKVAELFLKPNTEILIWPACAIVSVLCRGTHFCRIANTLRSGLLYSGGGARCIQWGRYLGVFHSFMWLSEAPSPLATHLLIADCQFLPAEV